jgi:7-cyano-7-deazaguanine reductase
MNTPNNIHSQTNVLGQPVSYETNYTSEVLYRIPRKSVTSPELTKIFGVDIWRSYEFSWLDPHDSPTAGSPRSGLLKIEIDAQSPYLVESKSLKLYLGSYAFHYGTLAEITGKITSELSTLLEIPVRLEIIDVSAITVEEHDRWTTHCINGICLDDHRTACDCYHVDSSLLCLADGNTHFNGTLYSNLLRTLCPITSQPDWATVEIRYNGPKIKPDSLLKYLISYRRHQGFHEFCCEQIFSDIWQRCHPDELLVACHFTRRGGLDITPVRSSRQGGPWGNDIVRTVRQ